MFEAFADAQFRLPVWFDLAAMFLFALTGAIKAMERDYDFIGVFGLALATGGGGGLLRDILVRAPEPVLLHDGRFLLVISMAVLAAILVGRRSQQLSRSFLMIDALGLAIYAVVGALRGIHAGFTLPATVLLGVINAVGGGLLRDVLTREEPLMFRPGQFYAACAIFGAMLFAILVMQMRMASLPAALIVIALTFTLRALTIKYDWRTRSWKRYMNGEPGCEP